MEAFELQAKDLAAQGKDRGQIEYELVRSGLDQQSAEKIARRHGAPGSAQRVGSGDGATHMVIGAIMALAGIVITVASYSAASGGGTYVVAWGLVVAGVIRFVRGLGRL